MTNPDLYRALDSAQRREKDPTKHLALCLRMNQEKHNALPAFKSRQDAILKPRVRVAAKTEVAL
jgi:hypothetical protein